MTEPQFVAPYGILRGELAAVRQAHLAHQDEERALLGDRWRDPWGNLVFTSETGAPIHVSCLLDHFKSVLKRTGLPAIRFQAP